MQPIELRKFLLKLTFSVSLIAHSFNYSAFAASDIGKAPPSLFRLVFIIDPDVTKGLEASEIGRRLAQYTADVNSMWWGPRSFVFNPISDLTIANPTLDPRCIQNWGVTPGNINVCITKSTTGESGEGYAGAFGTFPQSGSISMSWTTIYDPLKVSKSFIAPGTNRHSEIDYLRGHAITLAHELGHIFGAWDVYTIASRKDTTGVLPINDMSTASQTDRFWWSRWVWRKDLMMGGRYDDRGLFSYAYDRVEVLDGPALSYNEYIPNYIDDVNSIFTNTDWEGNRSVPESYLPYPTPVSAIAVDPISRTPLAGAEISVWRMPRSQPAVFLKKGFTDANGRFSFDWGCGGSYCFSSLNSLVLFKVTYPGRKSTSVWYSAWDLMKQKSMLNQTALTAEIPVPAPDSIPPTVTLSAPTSGIAGKSLKATAVASDNLGLFGVRFLIDGTTVCAQTTPPFRCIIQLPLNSNSANVVALAMDHAGNVSSSNLTVAISRPTDDIQPSISYTFPSSVKIGETIYIQPTVADNVGINRVDLYENGEQYYLIAKAPPYIIRWTPTKIGLVNLELRVTDTSGNSSSAGGLVQVSGIQ